MVWNQFLPSDASDASGGFGCKVGSRGGFYNPLDEGLDAMLMKD